MPYSRLTYTTFRETYLPTPYSTVFLEKVTVLQLVKKFPAFYGTRRFITAFTNARHLSLSWSSTIHSVTPHSTSWRSILMLSSHLSLGLPSGLFPSGFPTKTQYKPLLSPICATCSAYLILLDFITWTIMGEQYRSLSSSLCSFLHSLVFCSLLGPNTLFNTLFSSTLKLSTETITDHNTKQKTRSSAWRLLQNSQKLGKYPRYIAMEIWNFLCSILKYSFFFGYLSRECRRRSASLYFAKYCAGKTR